MTQGDTQKSASTRTRDLVMFAALAVLGVVIAIWLFVRGDMLPVLLALVAAALAWGVKAVIATWNPVALAAVVFPVFGVAYLGIAHAMRIPEAQVVLARLGRRFGMGTPR